MDNTPVPTPGSKLDNALAPLQFPEAVHDDALLLDHVIVVPELFHTKGFGLAEIEVVTAGQEAFNGVVPFTPLQLVTFAIPEHP